jgi:chromatin assembly factor 1 subunit B
MWTPPLTPAQGQGRTHSANSSVSGIHGISTARRESESEREDAAPSKKRELQVVPEVEEGREGKRRRIAPTPVTMDAAQDADIAIESTEDNASETQTPNQ